MIEDICKVVFASSTCDKEVQANDKGGRAKYEQSLSECSDFELRARWAGKGPTGKKRVKEVVLIAGLSDEMGQTLMELLGDEGTRRRHIGVCKVKDLCKKARQHMEAHLSGIRTREKVWIGDEENGEMLVAFDADQFPESALQGESHYVDLWHAVLELAGAGIYPLYYMSADPSRSDAVRELRRTMTVSVGDKEGPRHVWSQGSFGTRGKKTHCIIIIIIVVVIIVIFFFHPVKDGSETRISFDGERRTLSEISSKTSMTYFFFGGGASSVL